ncbi:MAG: hypothetical protein ACFB0Z_03210 [Candidatus Phaeomarinobacter sp.]
MRFARLCTTSLALMIVGTWPVHAQLDQGNIGKETRNGPFVATDFTLGDLLEQGFEIKGILGGALVLVQGTALYSCALTPDQVALSYKSQFECSVLDEIRSEAED